MGPLGRTIRLWHTVRHLKPVQFWGRARFRLARPVPDLRPAPARRAVAGTWVTPAARRASMTGPTTLLLLNEPHDVAQVGWDEASLAKLWRYNAHYFDDLCAQGAASRSAWHRALLERWMRANPPAAGTGWEPYPTSLRIVNWVKWAMAGNDLPAGFADSLAVQARWLAQRLEWHLLGNHLFVNAKALVFAGLFFEGPEADGWLALGARILRDQVPEQVLSDGGQFERSPMYHALALEDMLDLANVLRAFGRADDAWRALVDARIPAMRRWLQAMCHPDGEISFFNDAAIGVAPAPAELDAYARRLGEPALQPPADGITLLADSGYVRMQLGRAVVIADVGPVGPDYLPGHAHADTLSFELSLDGRRVLVNSGTDRYGLGAERLRQRGTAAHTTVTVDGQDSSEVWGGFRVARRAGVTVPVVSGAPDALRVSCSHDGYRRLPGAPVHRRAWTLTPTGLEVADELTGPGQAVAHWHWAPGNHPAAGGAPAVELADGGTLRIDCGGAPWASQPGTWHPEFGRIEPNFRSDCPYPGRSHTVRLIWS
jgi:uncharacterized heparinase superfamily protein